MPAFLRSIDCPIYFVVSSRYSISVCLSHRFVDSRNHVPDFPTLSVGHLLVYLGKYVYYTLEYACQPTRLQRPTIGFNNPHPIPTTATPQAPGQAQVLGDMDIEIGDAAYTHV